jgi:hypothetical protein
VDDTQRILEDARLNRRKMRVQELLPLQAFLEWLKKRLPFIIGFLFLPGRPDQSYYRSHYNYHVERHSLWRSLVGKMVDVSEDLDSRTEENEEANELELLREANQKLETDLRKLRKRLHNLDRLFDDQAAIIGALASGRQQSRGLGLGGGGRGQG